MPGQGQHVGRQRQGPKGERLAAGQPVAHFLPLYGDDLALRLLAVEQGKMGGFDIVGQLLFQQEWGDLQRRFTQARRQGE